MGGAVAARAMRWTPARLITDLQARDNLAADESYFLAEVRHVRRLVRPPDGDTPMLGLIDEPFRGTNSDEQVAAAAAVVKHLLASGHNFVVATHTSELTTLPDDRVAANYHFNEQLDADGMVFDYTIRPGPARTRNALLVLEREGYPREVLDDAHAWLRKAANQTRSSESHGEAQEG
jgi:DNA mismatch repair ATPase MutS